MPTEIRYDPVGRCIYCGAQGVTLGDEHIIPFSLAGSLLLPEASCRKCEKITHAFEFTVARQIFGNFRIKHGLPTRRPQQRPKQLPIGVFAKDGNHGTVLLPADEHPGPAFVYTFGVASRFLGLPPDVDTRQWLPIVIADDAEMKKARDRLGADPVFKVKMLPDPYARMLAKIAHSYAVAQLGIDGFRPTTLDIITGAQPNWCYLVGGTSQIPDAVPTAGHMLSLEFALGPRGGIIIVHVRLFANIRTPVYHVIAGEIDTNNQAHVAALKKNIPESDDVELPLAFRQTVPGLPTGTRIEELHRFIETLGKPR